MQHATYSVYSERIIDNAQRNHYSLQLSQHIHRSSIRCFYPSPSTPPNYDLYYNNNICISVTPNDECVPLHLLLDFSTPMRGGGSATTGVNVYAPFWPRSYNLITARAPPADVLLARSTTRWASTCTSAAN